MCAPPARGEGPETLDERCQAYRRGGRVRVDTIIPKIVYPPLDKMLDYVPSIRPFAVKADRDNHVWILPSTTLGAIGGGLLYDVVNKQGRNHRTRAVASWSKHHAGVRPGRRPLSPGRRPHRGVSHSNERTSCAVAEAATRCRVCRSPYSGLLWQDAFCDLDGCPDTASCTLRCHLPRRILSAAGDRSSPHWSGRVLTPIGALVTITGVLIALWAAGLFARNHTTIIPHGRSSALVLRGPYRLRAANPMYVSLTLLYIGAALWTGAWVALGLVVLPIAAMGWVVIGPDGGIAASGNVLATAMATTAVRCVAGSDSQAAGTQVSGAAPRLSARLAPSGPAHI